MAGNAIDLEQVDAPVGVEFGDGIVVSLRGGRANFQAIVVSIPGARIGDVSGSFGAITGACDGQVFSYGFFRDATQNVDAEFHAEGMNVVGEGLEAGAVFGGGNGVDGGNVAAIGVEGKLRSCA